MEFSECLREYMDMAGLNASKLAEQADLSVSSVSRYLSGKQTPGEDISRRLSKALSEAIAESAAAPAELPSEDEIYSALHRAAIGMDADYESCIDSLKDLLSTLNVSNNELARYMSYDPSYISRILGGSRRPSDLPQFLSDISKYLSRKFYDSAQLESLLNMLEFDGSLSGPDELAGLILAWLGQPHEVKRPQIAQFLGRLDEFDLDDFLQSIHFDDIKVPTLPFQRHDVKTYKGIKEMKQAELDFIKHAVLSKSEEDVILYSDMPLEEMSRDEDFTKKWMMGMALMIRKGLNLYMIHDVHRPLPEMLLGLEGWIPMYMTGQVRPYYLNLPTNGHFMHFIRSAGTVAITGEAICGRHDKGRYTVTRNKADVAYYRQRAKDLLHRADPLMKIYKEDRSEEFRASAEKILRGSDNLLRLSSLPPLFTMSEALLERILSHNDVSENEMGRIKDLHARVKKEASATLGRLQYDFELSELSPDDYDDQPARLPVSEIFPSADIRYSEDEYRQHIAETKEFAEENPGFSVTANSMPAFRNIDITISPGRAVLVSKSNPPIIHFLILHPQMIAAFEQFASR